MDSVHLLTVPKWQATYYCQTQTRRMHLVNSLPLLPVILHPQAWPYNADLLIPVVQTLTFHQAITP
jgi:hypothetical protein